MKSKLRILTALFVGTATFTFQCTATQPESPIEEAVPVEQVVEEESNESLAPTPAPVDMRLTLTGIECINETDPNIGSDETLVVFIMTDADVVAEKDKEEFTSCLEEKDDPEECIDLVVKIRDESWLRRTEVYVMDSDTREEDSLLVTPEDESHDWHHLDFNSNYKGEIIGQYLDGEIETISVPILSIHIITAMIFELDNGASNVVNTIRDQIESVKEDIETDTDIQSLLEKKEASIVTDAVGFGSYFGPPGLLIGWGIGEMFSGLVPEFIGHNTMIFTPAGYFVGNDAMDAIGSDTGALEEMLGCGWVPIEHYHPHIDLPGFDGSGANYRLSFDLDLPFDRIPDPQKIVLEGPPLVWDQNSRAPIPVTIANTGSSDLTVCGMLGVGRFTVDTGSCGSPDLVLNPNESCEVRIIFNPPQHEYDIIEGRFVVRSNDQDRRVASLSLLADFRN